MTKFLKFRNQDKSEDKSDVAESDVAESAVAGRSAIADRSDGIADDRALLDELGLTDSEAGSFLGKSRQALNNQLGPKKGPAGTAPLDYFKLSDILVLISAARQTGRSFDAQRVRRYVERTREPRDEQPNVPYGLLMDMLLTEPSELDVEGADTVVFMLPAFGELQTQRPDAATELVEVAEKLRKAERKPEMFVLSSTDMQAKSAGRALGVDESNCIGRDIVDHYLPTVLVYERVLDLPRPYVLTQKGTFVEAPHYRAPMIAECVRSLLPEAVSRALRPLPRAADRDAA